MTYNQAVQYLFDSAPMFQNVGAAAYKEGLDGTLFLDEYFGHPHRSYRTIHVGGTNGKGSVTHTLAAMLQAQGYRVGLYTSPHLVDFRERIRVNGKMISKKRVVEFVRTLSNSPLKGENFAAKNSLPLREGWEGSFSFFELATALAFKYFEEQRVDFAVVEVGLGGRLDCTNIITPVLSIITNISFDHVQFLGDTLSKIASEKAGIIKPGVPVVIGENGSDDVKAVFADKAREVGAPITFAEDERTIQNSKFKIHRALHGLCQEKNTRTILAAVKVLREQGISISDEAVERGFAEVTSMTGLMGRWQILDKQPLTICDTGHNVGGMQYIAKQLEEVKSEKLRTKKGEADVTLHIVIGMVSDKDVDSVLALLPRDATYYFTQASVKRAMPAEELAKRAQSVLSSSKESLPIAGEVERKSSTFIDVPSAYLAARQNASEDDIIFVGGSTFVVADLLAYRDSMKGRKSL